MARIAGAVGLKEKKVRKMTPNRLKRKGLVKRVAAVVTVRKKRNLARSIPLEDVVIARDVSIVKSLLKIVRESASIKESIYWSSIR